MIKHRINHLLNWITLRRNGVKYSTFQIRGRIYVENHEGSLVIGPNFSANSGQDANPIGGDTILRLIVQNQQATLTIGHHVGISNSTIVCWDHIVIGNHVIIGGGCKIWDTNFHSLNPHIRMSGADDNILTKPVFIDDYVFVGGGVTILKGVHIGKHSVIAAGSVVYDDIPAGVLAGGNPCQIIRSLEL
ncbi:MAG: acyltransferase [Spirosomataceae bacterium]